MKSARKWPIAREILEIDGCGNKAGRVADDLTPTSTPNVLRKIEKHSSVTADVKFPRRVPQAGESW
jgi:hypothetical protein